MNKNTLLNLLIILSVVFIIGLSSFIIYQFIKTTPSNNIFKPETSAITPTPTAEAWLFFATVDNTDNSQVHLKLIDPPSEIKSQTTISKTKISDPVTYSGAINEINIPLQHFQKQPSISDILEIYGQSDKNGQTSITKIELIK